MDSVERYLEVFEGLRSRKRWSTDTTILRFAALTLAAADTAVPGAGLEATAKVLADEAGGFSPLSSSVRHAVAAILIRRGLDPVTTVHRTKETLAAFKEFKLQRGGARPLDSVENPPHLDRDLLHLIYCREGLGQADEHRVVITVEE